MCLSLTITNGEVAYSRDNLTVGTLATYICNTGYSLMGLPTQQCIEDDQSGPVGVWNGAAPTCEGTAVNWNDTEQTCEVISNLSLTL